MATRPKGRARASRHGPRRAAAASDRDRFLALASHELRTPLTALALHLDSALRMGGGPGEADLPTAARAQIESARRQVRRMAFLVDEILDITRIQSGAVDLAPEELDLAALVRSVVTRRLREAESARATVSVVAPPALPGRWDPARVEQVLVHLLTNAFKFGGGRPVVVEVTEEGDRARLSVRDRGRGIAPEDQERIFVRYERADPAPEQAGLGLGLWIAREFVERMGGTIAVESREGEGARFVVELPLGRGG